MTCFNRVVPRITTVRSSESSAFPCLFFRPSPSHTQHPRGNHKPIEGYIRSGFNRQHRKLNLHCLLQWTASPHYQWHHCFRHRSLLANQHLYFSRGPGAVLHRPGNLQTRLRYSDRHRPVRSYPDSGEQRRHTYTHRAIEHLRRRSQIFKFLLHPIRCRGKSITIPVNFNTYGSIPNATVQFSCSGLQQGAVCTFSPPSMPLSSTGTVNLTISTTGSSSASLNRSRYGEETLAAFLALSISGIRRRRLFPNGLFVLLVCALLLSLSACSAGSGGGGSGSNPSNPNATPPGAYAITVTGSSGSTTRTTTVNVTVTSS